MRIFQKITVGTGLQQKAAEDGWMGGWMKDMASMVLDV